MARVITNSGGLTSGDMTLREMAKGLGRDDYVLFCNTGLEHPETLAFLHRQETELGVPLIWLEYCTWNKWKQVSFETASRNGEPMNAIISRRGYLPNPVQRFCTEILKIRVMRDFMRSQGHAHWISCVGLRADERLRYKRILVNNRSERWDVECPLYEAGITKRDVHAAWAARPFTLQLAPHEGNCRLCFEKSVVKRLAILRAEPECGDWYVDAEEAHDDAFARPHTVANLRRRALSQETINFYPEALGAESAGCFCGD